MQMLKSKLYLMKQQEQAEKMSDIRGEVRDINFGNQIRSYVMQPYTMVKDHRTNAEVSNVGGVMDGKYRSVYQRIFKCKYRTGIRAVIGSLFWLIVVL